MSERVSARAGREDEAPQKMPSRQDLDRWEREASSTQLTMWKWRLIETMTWLRWAEEVIEGQERKLRHGCGVDYCALCDGEEGDNACTPECGGCGRCS